MIHQFHTVYGTSTPMGSPVPGAAAEEEEERQQQQRDALAGIGEGGEEEEDEEDRESEGLLGTARPLSASSSSTGSAAAAVAAAGYGQRKVSLQEEEEFEMKRTGRKLMVSVAVFNLFLLLAAVFFVWAELGEQDSRDREKAYYVDKLKECSNLTASDLSTLEDALTEYFTDNWDYSGALFYVFSVASTIGYGNYTTNTNAGRWLTCFVGLVGIVLCYITLGTFANFVMKRVNKYNTVPKSLEDTRVYFLLALSIGFLLLVTFIFLGVEDWTFLNAFYFSVVSLTTTGMGDVVPSFVTHNTRAFADVVEVLVVCNLILLGLGIISTFVSALTPIVVRSKFSRNIDQYITDMKIGVRRTGQRVKGSIHEIASRTPLASPFGPPASEDDILAESDTDDEEEGDVKRRVKRRPGSGGTKGGRGGKAANTEHRHRRSSSTGRKRAPHAARKPSPLGEGTDQATQRRLRQNAAPASTGAAAPADPDAPLVAAPELSGDGATETSDGLATI